MKMTLALALVLLAARQAEPRDESDDQRRARLAEECSHMPSWRVQELDDYFLVTDVDDRLMLDELTKRIRATRALVEEALDPSSRGGGTPGPRVRDAEQARCKATLRVCETSEQYRANGGLGGTNGIYSFSRAEILLNSGLRDAGRTELMRIAQSMVTCEQFDRVLGPGDQAPWFQYGMQDYFAGFEFRSGKLARKVNPVRLDVLRVMLTAGRYAPLKQFCAFSGSEYNGVSSFGTSVDQHWAEGWSLMWFLMTADKTTYRGRDVLDRYVIRWKHDHSAAAATEFAFEGVDWAVLEREWRAFAEKIR